MENFINLLKSLPKPWKTILSAIFGVGVGILFFVLATSCGTTRAIIRTSADNTTSTITISTTMPTNVNVGVPDTLKISKNPNK